MECTFWNGASESSEELEDTQYTITFDGMQYTGTYTYSSIGLNESFVSDRYKTEDGVYFEIRRDTQELVNIEFAVKLYHAGARYKEDVEDPAATALSIATAYAKQYLEDFEAYTITVHDPIVVEKNRDGDAYRYSKHIISFCKKIGEYDTSDILFVTVSSKGDLLFLDVSDLSVLDEFEIIVNSELLNQSVDSKLKEIYANAGYTLVSYSIIKQTVCVTPEGKPCIMTYTETTVKDHSGLEIGTGIDIITYFDPS